MQNRCQAVLLGLGLGLLGVTSSFAAWDPADGESATSQGLADPKVAEAIANFKNSDPGIQRFFDNAYGYAVFPSIGKGGFGIGGAHGKGKVYEQGRMIGESSMTQVTIGFQLGGQKYSEIIFFKDNAALDRFASGRFEFGAQASAVALTAGASADAAYSNSVAIFTLAKGGLMYEASVGGQKFKFIPN
ncbi:MAG: YSC84-related protein [Gammaproteobacteria bacterium]|nr:YSC84-related protein [Gammaproteobacteria bacterium]